MRLRKLDTIPMKGGGRVAFSATMGVSTIAISGRGQRWTAILNKRIGPFLDLRCTAQFSKSPKCLLSSKWLVEKKSASRHKSGY